MATVTIRNLPAGVVARLKERAQRRGRSMEAEARRVLTEAVTREETAGAGSLLVDVVAARELLSAARKPRRRGPIDEGAPLKVRGRPLSESLVEDRR